MLCKNLQRNIQRDRSWKYLKTFNFKKFEQIV